MFGWLQMYIDHQQHWSPSACQAWSIKSNERFTAFSICTFYNVSLFGRRRYLSDFILATDSSICAFLNGWSCFNAVSLAKLVRDSLFLDGWGNCLADLSLAGLHRVTLFLKRWKVRQAAFNLARFFRIRTNVYKYKKTTHSCSCKRYIDSLRLFYCPFAETAISSMEQL